MDNIEILKNEVFSLPIIYSDSSLSCNEAVERKLLEYHDFLVDNHVDSIFHRFDIKTFIYDVSNMFKEYYLGHQNAAFLRFKEAIDKVIKSNSNFPVKIAIPKEPLYRSRVNDGDLDFKNEEMFHINYSKRSKVQTQRFSFPGLPCLYLGASSYVCWVELNRPSLEKFQVADIRQKDAEADYSVIDLGIHPRAFYNELKDREQGKYGMHGDMSLSDYLMWWPIMAMCSIAVKNEDDPFKPEYIFPQFMLQYILEDGTDNCIGIKYMSIKVGKISRLQYWADYRTYTNYVIPIRSLETTSEGYCKILGNQFYIKSNISGKELRMISGMIQSNGIEFKNNENGNDNNPLDDTYIYLKSGEALYYKKSEYRKIEKILDMESIKELISTPLVLSLVSDEEIEKIVEKVAEETAPKWGTF